MKFLQKIEICNMQTEFSQLLDQANNMDHLIRDCAQFLANHSTITWDQIREQANSNMLPNNPLTPATLALYVEAVALNTEGANDLAKEQRPFQRRRVDDDEEEDSFVVPDDQIEYEDSSSSSEESF